MINLCGYFYFEIGQIIKYLLEVYGKFKIAFICLAAEAWVK